MSLLRSIARQVILAEGLMTEASLMPDDLKPASIALAQYMYQVIPDIYDASRQDDRIRKIVGTDGQLVPRVSRDLSGREAREYAAMLDDLVRSFGDPRREDSGTILARIAAHFNRVSAGSKASQKKDPIVSRMDVASPKTHNSMIFPSQVLAQILPRAREIAGSEPVRVSLKGLPNELSAARGLLDASRDLQRMLPSSSLEQETKADVNNALNEIQESLNQLASEISRLEKPLSEIFDLTDEDLLADLVSSEPTASPVDIGGAGGEAPIDRVPEESQTDETLLEAFEVVRGAFYDLRDQIEELDTKGFDPGGAKAVLEVIEAAIVGIAESLRIDLQGGI